MSEVSFDLLELAETVKAFAIFFATITIAYAGFMLATSQDVESRQEWKLILTGVFIGLVLLFLAPLISAQLTGGTYCR